MYPCCIGLAKTNYKKEKQIYFIYITYMLLRQTKQIDEKHLKNKCIHKSKYY